MEKERMNCMGDRLEAEPGRGAALQRRGWERRARTYGAGASWASSESAAAARCASSLNMFSSSESLSTVMADLAPSLPWRRRLSWWWESSEEEGAIAEVASEEQLRRAEWLKRAMIGLPAD